MRQVIPIPERKLFTDEFDIMMNIEQMSGQTIQVIQAGIGSGNGSDESDAPPSNKAVYTNNMRGVAVFVSVTEPTDMQLNDIWIKI